MPGESGDTALLGAVFCRLLWREEMGSIERADRVSPTDTPGFSDRAPAFSDSATTRSDPTTNRAPGESLVRNYTIDEEYFEWTERSERSDRVAEGHGLQLKRRGTS